MSLSGSLKLFSKASTKMRVHSVMKSEYNCSRGKTLLASKSRRSAWRCVIQVLRVEPRAPVIEPKIAAKAGLIAMDRIGLISYRTPKEQREEGGIGSTRSEAVSP